MYSPLQLALRYIRYRFTASNSKGHGMHSPFVFEFITRVLNDKSKYPAYTVVENIRKELLHNPTLLQVEDYGAGSGKVSGRQRSVASIARHAAKPKKFGQLLFRMVRHYKPANTMELGTSLGITTCYLSLGQPSANTITLEGARAVAQVAKQNFTKAGLIQTRLVEGNFDTSLPPLIRDLPTLDFIFIDGNHRKEPTLRYMEQLLAHSGNDTILVFDDIHWSREMEEAWDQIKSHPRVRCTMDLFFIGIVVLRQEFHEKQHFTIRF